jgi:hypothetical protein
MNSKMPSGMAARPYRKLLRSCFVAALCPVAMILECQYIRTDDLDPRATVIINQSSIVRKSLGEEN